MVKKLNVLVLMILFCGGNALLAGTNGPGWEVNVLPASVRLDPTSNKIIEQRFRAVNQPMAQNDLLDHNWIYDGKQVVLYAARGEYISFQLVITNHTDSTLKGIKVEMSPFQSEHTSINIRPELFLEWAVEVKTPSTGYSNASLGKGWYPDALIPLDRIQMDSSKVKGRWIYPLWLPDFNNRIDHQLSQLIWVDQYIPFNSKEAKAGTYTSTLTVTVEGQIKTIPLRLVVWDFAIPNENRFQASLQQEGFLSSMDEKRELEVYQLFKRNRVALMDPTYHPELTVTSNGANEIKWDKFDERLKKYFTGEAFTSKYGYQYGPGYGEPFETFILPFDVYGKRGTKGWPDVGKPEVERTPAHRAAYINIVHEVRAHLQTMVNTKKTDFTIYLNGLDESYFPEAWDRMVYYGKLFKDEYPEAKFRVDGAYSEEAMSIIGNSINAWGSHTINYNIDKISKYQKQGIQDWLYGPMLYESKVNSWVGSSTFLDLPLVNDRAISWSCWKYHTYSWISWGIGVDWARAWYDPETWKDVYKDGADSDPNFTYKKLNGNALLVYSPGIIPNVNKVCPSIRLKTMRNGIQEYEFMRLLSNIDKSRERADAIVNNIIKQPFGDAAIGNLDVWNYDAEKWDQNRIKLGEMINEANKKSKDKFYKG